MSESKTNPIPGYWYSVSGGLLIQIRALLYIEGTLTHVLTEDIGGARFKLLLSEWLDVDAVLHSPEDTPSVDLWQR